ncbi:MAG: pyruvate, orthophosphate dikinase [Chloroflexi bacterium]|jgi:pyruvate,orthophosphate dikinase|nr:MAG: pyruvate, orthophosphate dikinase [Chloroflexota bacterium]|tara:strand:- start:1524 stop:4208 length:2685 start_codon:yes stop_codon:yes gene_type:complete
MVETSSSIFFFGDGKADGNSSMRDLLGGKGAGLAEMSNAGIPVPPGITITTDTCAEFFKNNNNLPDNLKLEMQSALIRIGKIVGTEFGSATNPLLLSVRSGARVSMPGMMDTVLNLGLNDETVQGLADISKDPRFAYDSYRRFVAMFGDVVLGVRRKTDEDEDPFEHLLNEKKKKYRVELDTELDVSALKELVSEYKALIFDSLGVTFPDDPWLQLWAAISAVFLSWHSDRAKIYRKLNNFSDSWGTAVNVQSMVFGNLGDNCATGVCFTRDPSNGLKGLVGEYLINAQGEDVVAGVRTPQKILKKHRTDSEDSSLEESMPKSLEELLAVSDKLEHHFGDMQDIEFTIQQNKLWILQTRNAKRTGLAMVKIAVDLVEENFISKEEALKRIDPEQINELLHPIFKSYKNVVPIAQGLAASPGAAVGKVVFTAADASIAAKNGKNVILVRDETSPEDIEGMTTAVGILTARGGTTSHAAVVARGMGKPCITGCKELKIDYKKKIFTINTGSDALVIMEGDVISIDGTTGLVLLGALETEDAVFPDEYEKLLSWANAVRTINVRSNADTPEDARRAREFGAEGIGLCRTEHMFFGESRILAFREMICAETKDDRLMALNKILPIQRDDFIGIFRAMNGLPVTIRLLDPPLHEFLPNSDNEIKELAETIGKDVNFVISKVDSLREINPMLGHRGVRLAVTSPEIYEIQVRAIIEAACQLKKENISVLPEIMIPLIGLEEEIQMLSETVHNIAKIVMNENNVKIDYLVGTMIELPRACIIADKIAHYVDFFSFGTNDLTQTTFGLSRDDSSRFLPDYINKGIFNTDPFVEIDQPGVGALVEIGIKNGRSVKKDLKIGICGEHGGNPPSIKFCYDAGMNYVSCSPFRVPIALFAAAQASL